MKTILISRDEILRNRNKIDAEIPLNSSNNEWVYC